MHGTPTHIIYLQTPELRQELHYSGNKLNFRVGLVDTRGRRNVLQEENVQFQNENEAGDNRNQENEYFQNENEVDDNENDDEDNLNQENEYFQHENGADDNENENEAGDNRNQENVYFENENKAGENRNQENENFQNENRADVNENEDHDMKTKLETTRIRRMCTSKMKTKLAKTGISRREEEGHLAKLRNCELRVLIKNKDRIIKKKKNLEIRSEKKKMYTRIPDLYTFAKMITTMKLVLAELPLASKPMKLIELHKEAENGVKNLLSVHADAPLGVDQKILDSMVNIFFLRMKELLLNNEDGGVF